MKIKSLIIICLFLITEQAGYTRDGVNRAVDQLMIGFPNVDSEPLKKEFSAFIDGLTRFDGLSDEKRLKKVLSVVSDTYFKVTGYQSFFPEILKSKRYTLLTGSCLLALVLTELNIPFEVTQRQTEVYFIIYPKDLSYEFKLPVTDASFYYLSEMTKRLVIGYLRLNNLITDEEVDSKGFDPILANYLTMNRSLQLDDLISIHQVSRAIYLYDKEQYFLSFDCIDAAEKLVNLESNRIIAAALTGYWTDQVSYESIHKIHGILRYSNYIEGQKEFERIQNNFTYTIYEALITRGDQNFVDSASSLIPVLIADSTSFGCFQALVYQVYIHWYLLEDEYGQAYQAASEMLISCSDSSKNQTALILTLYNYMAELDEREFVQKIEKYIADYPFLVNNQDFIDLCIASYANGAADYFLYNDFEEGEECLKKMETFLALYELDVDEHLSAMIGEAYAQLSTWYFRNKDYQQAALLIEKALEYDPENQTHQNRKNYILSKL